MMMNRGLEEGVVVSPQSSPSIRRPRHSERRLWGAVEIIPGRLYYAPLKFFPTEDDDDDDVGDGSDYDDDDGDDEGTSVAAGVGAGAGAGAGAREDPPSVIASSSIVDAEMRRPNPPHTPRTPPPAIHYFSMDAELVYWNFFLDFGPLNLGQLYRFCERLNDKLSNVALRNHVLCYYSGIRGSQRANATYLICAWSMLYLRRTVLESYYGFEETDISDHDVGEDDGDSHVVGASASSAMTMTNSSLPPRTTMPRPRRKRGRGTSSSSGDQRRREHQHQPLSLSTITTQQQQQSPFGKLHPLPPYHDASPVACTYDLSVKNCLMGLERARRFGFFRFGNAPTPPPSSSSYSSPSSHSPNLSTSMPTAGVPSSSFDVDEYEHFEQVENGDLNWIISGRILAFAGPQSQRLTTSEGYCVLTPDEYIPYFRQRNVDLVIQLNKGCYDGERFANAGIRHVSHTYPDGSCPDLNTLHDVLSDMEGVPDNMAFAVHCKAGLGRTGTCIGAYIMKHYGFTAREVIGYMRICRPGMVIGPQQHFLEDIEHLMWQEGDAYRGVGLRSGTSRGGVDLEEGMDPEEVEDGAAAMKSTMSSSPISKTTVIVPSAVTPRATVGVAIPPPHISIVTPDGLPFRLITTPVMDRRLHIEESPSSSTSPSSTPARMLLPTPTKTPSLDNEGSTAMAGNTATSNDDADNNNNNDGDEDDDDMQEVEVDQASALLSRRLDQYQARRQQCKQNQEDYREGS